MCMKLGQCLDPENSNYMFMHMQTHTDLRGASFLILVR